MGCTGNADTSLDYGVCYAEGNGGEGGVAGVDSEDFWLGNNNNNNSCGGRWCGGRGSRSGEGEDRAVRIEFWG